jgi:hypothetical protein
LFSCSIQKNRNLNNLNTAFISTEINLTEIETNIVNDFLNVELKKDRYKSSKDFEYAIIEEALKKSKAINSYLYSYQEWLSMNKIDEIGDVENRFFLDSLQIKKIKVDLEREEAYNWKVSDFKNIKVSLLKYEELRIIINTGTYTSLPKKLIMYLSKPLIIDENNAFISFEIGNGQLGFASITHFTVLMKKVNNKWVIYEYYYDGVFN